MRRPRAVLLVGLLAGTLAIRPQLTAVGPLLPEIQDDFGIDHATRRPPGDGARPVHGAVRAAGRPAAATNRCAHGDRLVPRHDRDRDGPAPALARILGDGRAHLRVRSRLRRGGRVAAGGGEGALRRAAGTRHGRVRARAQRRRDARGRTGGAARTRHGQLALVARIARSGRRAGGAGLGTALARLPRTRPAGRDRRPPAVAQRLRLVGDPRVRLPGALLLRPQRVARRRAHRGRLARGQRRRARRAAQRDRNPGGAARLSALRTRDRGARVPRARRSRARDRVPSGSRRRSATAPRGAGSQSSACRSARCSRLR